MESITLKRQLESTAAAQALWAVLADTSRRQLLLGPVPLKYRPRTDQPKSAARCDMFAEHAWGGLVGCENPVEWLTSKRRLSCREYPRGPRGKSETPSALASPDQGTRLAIELVLAPPSLALRLLRPFGPIGQRPLLQTLCNIEAAGTRSAKLRRRVTAPETQS